MCTTPDVPAAAKFLLNWPTTDVNLTNRSGWSFLALVRSTITDVSVEVARPDSLDRLVDQFLFRQWREIEEMLMERRAAGDTGGVVFTTILAQLGNFRD
jgi:hypothetical protein